MVPGTTPCQAVTPIASRLLTMPSFVRGIFAGALHDCPALPLPDPLDVHDPDEAKTVRRLIAALRQMQARGPRSIRPRSTSRKPSPSRRSARSPSTGCSSLTIPKEYGGVGLSSTGYARVFGEVSRIDASLAVLIGVHCGLGSKAIVLFGSRRAEGALPADARARRDARRVRAHRARHRLRRAEHQDDGAR